MGDPDKKKRIIGTHNYIAPEILNVRVDWWALGISCLNSLSGCLRLKMKIWRKYLIIF